MAAASSYIPSIKLPTFSSNIRSKRALPKRLSFRISAQQQAEIQESEQLKAENENEEQEGMKQQQKIPTPIEPQVNVKNRNLAREYGGQWLSSVTRHVRIYAAYIDPETCAMDQTQMDKLTLILDPTNEFLWTDDNCNQVYNYFQELVDHYEGAPLTEYTLRLIGSDIEHYIRKMLYDGEIKYNMNSRVLNFSMGKPRMKFNSNELPDVQ
ncbi:NAD(P)H-quinone oxidoreductase subunit M, chloroplastic-like [Chenopodium quinoa]|uniref:NAD(P)H-quinone oxidoreductase subunit M, chloroplastic n=1 Tax=Chenopodium quinoa TaxID=63459 RepID=A0A803LHI9_CHEQI|nr:NAD(P)H-quinone oxidoreductase subunit M, chloroplastic-like [Chenopodium quinoa]XP_021760904.1 NAD(P)H-quinone oxidoreductase subunit M, chloroplastic-like [Chenopodium quinoa]